MTFVATVSKHWKGKELTEVWSNVKRAQTKALITSFWSTVVCTRKYVLH
jgi:hypothetical protein